MLKHYFLSLFFLLPVTLLAQQEIIVKFKSEASGQRATVTPDSFLKQMGAIQQKQLFLDAEKAARTSHRKSLNASKIRQVQEKYRIGNIYKVRLAENLSAEELQVLAENPAVEYIEPVLPHYPLDSFLPNDPSVGSQYALAEIKAFEAWGITQGSSDVIIAVVDTGFDLNHPDLKDKFWHNEAELNGIEGVDDDGNGYIDDITGWDFGDKDNDITFTHGNHGMRVAGICAASTDNETGIAGLGFNSTLMALKTGHSSGALHNSFEAVIYAAENGADVINMSWGQNVLFSRYEQEVVNYLTEAYDVLLVGAAGNDGNDKLFYPASYDNVLSVAASSEGKGKWGGSNFNYQVDILAPGAGILSSVNGSGYASGSGTSFAAPYVSGAAALLKSLNPSLGGAQMAEILRVSSDPSVYSINTSFEEQLGYGFLNVRNALEQYDMLTALRMTGYAYSDASGSSVLAPGETFTLSPDFTNYLQPVSDVTVTLTEVAGRANITNASFTVTSVNSLQTFSSPVPFEITINEDHLVTDPLEFRFEYTDENGYADYQHFTLIPDSEGADINFNNITIGFGDDGRFGTVGTYDNPEGSGFKYMDGPNLLEEGGLILATDMNTVSDALMTSPGVQNNDFTMVDYVSWHQYDTRPFYSLNSSYEDVSNNANPVNVLVDETLHQWYSENDQDFVYHEYEITNQGTVPIETLYSGLFTDWNLSTVNDFVAFDTENEFGYTYDPASEQYIGMKVLSNDLQFYAIDLDNTTTGNNLVLTDDFTDAEKFAAVSGGIVTPSTAGGGEGNDVAMVIGASFSNIAVGGSVTLRVITVYATSLSDLQDGLDRATSRVVLQDGILDQTWVAVENLSVTPKSSTSNQLIWEDKATDEDHFLMYRATDENFYENVRSFQIPANSTSFTDTGLTPGTTYYYRIVAKK